MTQDSKRLVMFCAGLSLGAAIGMIAAPKAGAEMRRRLASSAHTGREFFDKTREIYHEGLRIAEEAAEMFDEGRKLVRG